MDCGIQEVKGLKIHITGIVQGVGFRPFIYRLAQRFNLKGTVLNNSQGVFIEVWGRAEELALFLDAIRLEAPEASSIEGITEEDLKGIAPEDFTIIHSEASGERGVFISPDLAICKDCLQELADPKDFRYQYPFINCTNCGPRFSIIEDIPYDRPFTTMVEFPMCVKCQGEYQDPLNRRFHAQPNACGSCGPHYTLASLRDGEKAVVNDSITAITRARELLKQGEIIAIKGIGGYHLSCDATDEKAVELLRKRKGREAKPLAVMVKDLATARRIVKLDELGEKLLSSPGAPIVLAPKAEDYALAQGVAPHNPYLGLMLAYAPIHHLLLERGDVLVMTSGNLSHEPMIYTPEEANKQLPLLADYILDHNRRIANPVDDSVVALGKDSYTFIRRGRGYAPVPVELPGGDTPAIIAMGGELKNTFAINKGKYAFLSPHLGDLENQKTYTLYKNTLNLYKRLFDLKPEVVVRDMHPQYFSSQYAEELNLPIMEVQHHHAHIASVLAEHRVQGKVLGIALDGTGYGDDQSLWGGEFLWADLREYKRLAHFPIQKLPGGAKAIKEIWRLALYQAYLLYGKAWQEFYPELNYPGAELLLQAATNGLNAPLTTSAGRVFDTVSALLGICHKISYEGQGAIELELMAQEKIGEVLSYGIDHTEDLPSLNFQPMYRELLNLKNTKGLGYAAYSAHLTIAQGIKAMVKYLAKSYPVEVIAFSGGVCQNRTLMELLQDLLKDYTVLTNGVIPVNDGGLAYGQLAIARARLAEEAKG